MTHLLLLFALSGQMADVGTTCSALSRGSVHETNALLGSTCGSIATRKALIIAPAVTWAALEHRSHPKLATVALIALGSVGTMAAIHNYGVRR